MKIFLKTILLSIVFILSILLGWIIPTFTDYVGIQRNYLYYLVWIPIAALIGGLWGFYGSLLVKIIIRRF